MLTNATSIPSDRGNKYSTINLLLLGGLLFLRFPFLIVAGWMLETTLAGIAYFIFTIGTYLLTAVLIWRERERLKDFWVDLAAAITFLFQMYCFPIGIGLFVAMRRHRTRFPSPPTTVWRWALLGAILAIACNIFTVSLGIEPPGPRVADLASFGFLIPAIFIQMTHAAVWEEPLFRGFLWGYLRRVQWKDWWIWLFQALLFTLGHVYYLKTEALAPWFIRMMLPSLLIGFIAWRAKSIFASMVTHGVFNASGDMLLHTRSVAQAVRLGWATIVVIGVICTAVWIGEMIRNRHVLSVN